MKTSETIQVVELENKARRIIHQQPELIRDPAKMHDFVLYAHTDDEVIAYLVEVKNDDNRLRISDIEKFIDHVSIHFTPKRPLKIHLVKYSDIGKNIDSTNSLFVQPIEIDDSEARKRIAKRIGLTKVPKPDKEAISRLEGMIKRDKKFGNIDSVNMVRAVREDWTDYQ